VPVGRRMAVPCKTKKTGGQTQGAVEGKGGRCRAGCSPVNEGPCAASGLGGGGQRQSLRGGDHRTMVANAGWCGGDRQLAGVEEMVAAMVEQRLRQ
jgi:hypothetical protein